MSAAARKLSEQAGEAGHSHLVPGVSDPLLVQLQDLGQVVLGEDLGIGIDSLQALVLYWLGLILRG